MGCESSLVSNNTNIECEHSSSSDQSNKLELSKFIERQRGDVFELYHFSKVLSRGSNIIRQVMERNSRIERVCKIKTTSKQLSLLRALQEVQILKRLNHPNIVQVIEYFSQQGFLYMMLEQIPGKTIYDLFSEDHFPSMKTVIEVIRQLLIAINFCHQHGYAHKAINPEHVMIVSLAEPNALLVKLVGFGNAHKIGTPVISSAISQSVFTAPEAHNEQQVEKQDIWGCGVIFLQLLSGQRNFKDFLTKKSQIAEQIIDRQQFGQRQKTVMKNFIQKMLQIAPSKRISAEEALKHQLFQLEGRSVRTKENARVLEKLMQYRVEVSLKTLLSMYGSLTMLSVAQKSENLVEFYNLDKNKDGKIDFEELVEGLKNTFALDDQTARHNVEKIFSQAHKSQDHFIEFNEFVMATIFMKKEMVEKILRKMFDQLDTNKDEIVSLDELLRCMEGVDEKYVLRELGKRELNFSDFRKLMLDIYKGEHRKQKEET